MNEFMNGISFGTVLGIFIMLFVYHLLVWLDRHDRKNRAYSIFCGCSILYIAFLRILPTIFINSKVVSSLGTLSIVAFSGSIFLFTISIYNINKKIKNITIFLFLLLLICSIIFSCLTFLKNNINYIKLFDIFSGLYALYFFITIIITVLLKKQYNSETQRLVLFGLIIMLFGLTYVAIIAGIKKQANFFIAYTPLLVMNFLFARALTLEFNHEHKDLINLTNTLEQKVIDRTKKLEKAHKQKTEAFINISHEIKTPATIISNYLDKHIEEHGATKELEIAQQNTNKLKRDMLNVLDFEKLDKGLAFYDHSKIADLSEIVRMNILMFAEIANRKGIKLKDDLEENIYIKADPAAMDRVVNNLIDNAIKYNESNGKINVLLRADKTNIELAVRDTGIGISEKNRKHIFKPYYQVSEKKSNMQGIGMGLNIVKNIIDDIKGEIRVESALNIGATFRIILKRYFLKEGDRIEFIQNKKQKNVDVMKIELNPENHQESKSNVFIVDDNIQMLSYLQENLLGSYNVYYAENGKEALNKIKTIPPPDIIISDIMMDEMDGYEFYDELLKLDEYRSAPFIFLTAKTKEYEKIKGLKKGALDFISKPFNINELKAKVESLIKFRNALKKEKLDELSEQIYRLLSESKRFKIGKNEKDREEKIKQDKLFIDYGISKRQVEIFSLIENGYERKEIADKLNISLSTVKTHINRLYKRFGVNNKINLIKTIKSL